MSKVLIENCDPLKKRKRGWNRDTDNSKNVEKAMKML